MENNVELRKLFMRKDPLNTNQLDIVTFFEVMSVARMELNNEEAKLVCEKYDPEDRGRLYYNAFCDDIEESATLIEADFNLF